jgi:hypothetical protein
MEPWSDLRLMVENFPSNQVLAKYLCAIEAAGF